MRALLVAVIAALALTAAGAAGAAQKRTCPAAWLKGWQALADKVEAPVYCPTWMPNPLDAQIKGQYIDIYSIDKDHSYLVSFLEHGDVGSGDVHVNFRGYPGKTAIPRCPGPVKKGSTVACFSNPVARLRSNGIDATVYQVNQGADQWHILLAWHYRNSLYTVSEHVIPPYRFSTQVRKNLAKLLSGLVIVRPQP
jgi:hypothetical protein